MEDTNQPFVHLRLSLQAPAGMSPLLALVRMKSQLNPLMSFLDRELGNRIPYIWCIECTERGYCHFHIMFIGCNWLISKEKLDTWWENHSMGYAPGVYIEKIREGPDSAKRMQGYMVGYVSKANRDPKWSGLLTLTRKREWGMSKSLRTKLARWKLDKSLSVFTCTGSSKTNSSFTFIGILTDWEVRKLILGQNPDSDPAYMDPNHPPPPSSPPTYTDSAWYKPDISALARRIFPSDGVAQ